MQLCLSADTVGLAALVTAQGGRSLTSFAARLSGSVAGLDERAASLPRHASRSSVRTPDRAIETNVAADEIISKTTRFEGTDAKSGFLIDQQVRWPALNHSAVKRRREPPIGAERLRFRYAISSVPNAA